MSKKEQNIITKEFDGVEIYFKTIEGTSYVRIDEVAKFCGWTQVKKGKEYIKWERVNGFLEEINSPQVGKGDFIPEYQMYMLIGKANNERATKFMLWVGQVLVELRTKGVVILENAEDEVIDFEKKFGAYRIRKTFTNSSNPRADFEEFLELSAKENKAKRITAKERVKRLDIIFDTVSNRIDANTMRASEVLGMQELLTDIKIEQSKIANNGRGGELASATKKIKKLEASNEALRNTVESLDEQLTRDYQKNVYGVSLDKFMTIPVHGFSENYRNDRKRGRTVNTEAYSNWVNKATQLFPNNAREILVDSGVDLTSPMRIYLAYVSKPEFDHTNLNKTAIDLISDILGFNDVLIDSLCSTAIGECSEYYNGKIMFYLENV